MKIPRTWLVHLLALSALAIASCNGDTPQDPLDTTPTSPGNGDALQYIFDNHQTLGVCEDSFEQESASLGSQVYAVDEQTKLVQLQCSLAAYQGVYEYYLYSETNQRVQVKPLMLAGYIPNDSGNFEPQETRILAGLPDYNPEEKLLSIFTKGRGLGDCGTFAEYRLVGEKFELQEYRVKLECDGNYIEPTEYPLVYPTQ